MFYVQCCFQVSYVWCTCRWPRRAGNLPRLLREQWIYMPRKANQIVASSQANLDIFSLASEKWEKRIDDNSTGLVSKINLMYILPVPTHICLNAFTYFNISHHIRRHRPSALQMEVESYLLVQLTSAIWRISLPASSYYDWCCLVVKSNFGSICYWDLSSNHSIKIKLCKCLIVWIRQFIYVCGKLFFAYLNEL